MASNTVKGLTVELNGDTTKLGKALQAVERQSRSLSKELKDIQGLLKYDPSNVDALRQKHDLLTKAITACAKKLATLEDAEEQVQAQFKKGKVSEEQVRALQREIIATKNKMDDYMRSLEGVDKALDAMGDESKEAATKVDKLGEESDETESEVKNLRDATDKAGDGFTVFKGVISNLISEGLQLLIEKLKETGKYILQTGMDFGQTMSRVEALIDPSERTAESMQKLTDYAMEMGAKTKFSANESAEAMTYLAQAGWGTQDILDGLGGVMALAATDGIDLATAAEITAQAINSLGYTSADAGKFADLLAVTASATCTNVEEMGLAFQYVGPVAGALGYDMEDLAVAIGMMADSGITGEKAGTSLRSLFTNLSKPTADMSAAMDKYGVSLTTASGEMKPLGQLMTELRGTFNGLSEAQKTELAATLAGKTGMAGLLSIVNASDEEFKAMTSAIDGANGAAEEMAAVMQDNLAGDVEKLTGAFETLALKIEKDFDGALRKGAQAITAFLDGEASLTETLSALGGVISQVFETLRGYLPTLVQMGGELIQYIVNGITTGLPNLLRSGSQMATNLINGLAQNLPALAQKGLDAMQTFITNLYVTLPSLIQAGRDALMNLVSGISENLPSLVSKALDVIMDFAHTIYNNAPSLIQTGFDLLSKLVQGILNCLPTLISKVPEIISRFANTINDNFPTIIKKGVELIWQIIKGIISAIPTLIKNIPKIITAIVDVWEAFNWLSLGKKAIDLLGKGIKGMVGWVKSAGKSVLDGCVNIIKNLPSNLLKLGQSAAKGLGNALKAGVTFVKNGAKAIGDGIINFFKGLPSKLLQIGKDLIKGLWNGISDMTGWVIGKIQGFGESVLDGIKNFFGIKSPSRVMRDQVGKMLGLGMAEGITDSVGDVQRAMNGLNAATMGGLSTGGFTLENNLRQRGAQMAMDVTAKSDLTMQGKLDKILAAIERGQVLMLDSKTLVGHTANMYDNTLGQRRVLVARGAL